jgi:hypothetical protein
MNRKDLIRLAVLLEISDDYEQPAHVYVRVTERLRACEVLVNPEDIGVSLRDLVESGLARAYRISGLGPVEDIEGMPAIDHLQDYYFWITDKGRLTLTSWRHEWPLDEEDQLIPGWSPPS